MKNNYYITYITKLILPLMGISDESIFYTRNNISDIRGENGATSDSSFSWHFKNLFFGKKDRIVIDLFGFEGEYERYLSVPFNVDLSEEQFNLFSYLLFSLYHFLSEHKGNLFNNAFINETVNNLVLQKGLFAFILKDLDYKNEWIDDLYKGIQHWSEKTYEGKNVCFGFLINPKEKGSISGLEQVDIGNFVDFISEEYSAVFTDGISSLVEIDSKCNFIRYHSTLHQKSVLPDNFNDVQLPIRFAQIISENVVNDKIGLFLLTNGDIIIAQKQKISFVKRAGRWLNFSQSAFYSIISEYTRKNGINKLIPPIYCSALDISFAHSGGLIAVVDTESKEWEDALKGKKPLLSKVDLFHDSDFDDFPKSLINLYNKEFAALKKNKLSEKESVYQGKIKDLKKRLTKRRYLIQILKEECYFNNIDRKLRADLSGLDGAIILDTKGKIIACGAIIANKAGSSGGGRGSAARTLSQYGGFSLKISTDGYIEAFVNEARIYSIK